MQKYSAENQKLGIIIVSYNSESDLGACLASVAKATKLIPDDAEVIVVDNNSEDLSIKIAENAGAHIIKNDMNRGFAAAVNQGMRLAITSGCHYLLLLNPDSVVEEECLIAMINGLRDKKIAAVGAKLIDVKAEGPQEYYLRTPDLLSVALFSTFVRQFAIKNHWLVNHVYVQPLNESAQNVELLPGACILTTRPVVDDVGMLDEDYAIWFEDVDWCYRAKRKGYSLVYEPTARMHHNGGNSFRKWISPEKNITFYVSMKTFFRKHKPIKLPLVVLLLSANSLILWLRKHDRAKLYFIRAMFMQKRGKLPS